MASNPTVRGNSTRTTWLLRGNGPKQSFTVSDGTPGEQMKIALAAKALAESRNGTTSPKMRRTRSCSPPPVACVGECRRSGSGRGCGWRRCGTRDTVQPHVADAYERILEVHWVRHFAHQRITEISREDIAVWVRKMKKQRATFGGKDRRYHDRALSAGTILRYFVVGSSCLASAVPKWLEKNPAEYPRKKSNDIGLPKMPDSVGMFLTGAELDLVLANCPPALHDIAFVASRSGLRIGELIALEVRDVLFRQGGGATIMVRRGLKPGGVTGLLKSEASKRDVPVEDAGAEVLVRRTKGRSPSARVFVTDQGQRWNDGSLRNSHWARALGAAQRCAEHPPPAPPQARYGPYRPWGPWDVSTCDCVTRLHRRPRFHDLRHTHASALIASGMHVKKIQRRLGHAKFETTMNTYGHLIDLGDRDELLAAEMYLSSVGSDGW
jgi:integrase